MVLQRIPPKKSKDPEGLGGYYGYACVFEDFFWDASVTPWAQFVSVTNGTPTFSHPAGVCGLLQCQIANVSGQYVNLLFGSSGTVGGWVKVAYTGSGAFLCDGFEIIWRGKCGSLTSAAFAFGVCGTDMGTSDRIVIYYASNEGANWRIQAKTGTSATTVDTGISADTNWHEFKIDCLEDVAYFFIDGAAVGSISTNLPASFMSPIAQVVTLENVAKYLVVDFVRVELRQRYAT